MKIKSPFKDYYDYIAHQYGGGDPRVLYIRSKITAIDGVNRKNLTYSRPKGGAYYNLSRIRQTEFVFKWCIVCGIQYLIVCPSVESYKLSAYSLLTDSHPAMKELQNNHSVPKFISDRLGPGILQRHGKNLPDAINLSRSVKSPVFTMDVRDTCIEIDDIVPNLKVLGFDKLIQPEQMYQNIALWVGNTLKDSPDDNPPKSISNVTPTKTKRFKFI